MTNRYLTLLGPSRISDTYNDINLAFDGIQGDFDNHVANNSGAHGATSAATANRLMQRDAQGRAKVAAPNASDDIARKAEVDAAITAAAMDASSKMASVHADLDAHTGNADIHTSAVEKTKLAGIAAGAEVNQNAFSKIGVTGQPDIVAGSKTDTVSIKGGTGITVSTNATSKEVTITATGTSTPGAHAASHITGGSDVIPDAVSGGASGLFSGVDKAKLDGMASGPDSTTDVMIGDRTANPALVPTGLTGKLTQWLSWFTNRIKAITGMTNWWDDPPATLSSLNTNKAPLNSPALTGTPTTPTAAVGTSTTQIASAQLVKASVDAHVAAADPHTQYAPKASPSFTGVVSSQSTATLGSNAGDTVELRKEIGSVNGNVSGLITRIRRAIAGTGWVNADVDILRRTDSTDQQRISFRGDGGMSIVGTAGGTLDLENNHLHVKNGNIYVMGVEQARTKVNNGALEFWDGTQYKGAGGLKNVQRGYTNLTWSSGVVVGNITVSAVNLSKSFVNATFTAPGGSGSPTMTARMTSTTNLEIQVMQYASSAGNINIAWEVVEFF